MLSGQICPNCDTEMKSPYMFKDSKGNWHFAHKYCCNELQRKIEKEIGRD